MPTGELLAASVFVTYLGEGGGVEGGIGLGDGGAGRERRRRGWRCSGGGGGGKQPPRGFGQARATGGRGSGRPPASASLGQLADAFSLAGATGLTF